MDDKKIKMDLDQIAKGNVNGVTQALEIPAEMVAYLESMMVEAKVYTDDKELNNRIIGEIYLRLVAYINSRVVDLIPDEKLEEFNQLLENKNNSKEIDDFIVKNMPNYGAVYNTILLEFKDIYLGKMDMSEIPDAIKV